MASTATRSAWPLLLSMLLLGACSSLPPPADGGRSYSGRFSLSVIHASAGTEEQRAAWSGRFSLAVGERSMALDLVSPLGVTIARFETDAHEARILVPADGGIRIERGADAQALSERVLGWSLPVAGMSDWVEGRPAGGRPFRALPAQADSSRFEQDGWDVTIEQPTQLRPGLRLQMDRAGLDGAPAVALRVVLDGPDS